MARQRPCNITPKRRKHRLCTARELTRVPVGMTAVSLTIGSFAWMRMIARLATLPDATASWSGVALSGAALIAVVMLSQGGRPFICG
jgi:hypothetical protein